VFKLPDIYLIITPDPSDAFISQRQKAISSLANDDTVAAHFPEWVELVWLGLPTTPVGKVPEGVAKIIDAIQLQQPSFPGDPIERALDLRVTTAAVLHHYLSEPPSVDGGHSLVLSAVIVATSKFRAFQSEPRYNQLVESLRLKAQSVIDEAGAAIRKRKELIAPNVRGADFNTIISSANEALTEIGKTVTNNMCVDREEMQVLWWVFGRYSKLLHAPYAALGMGDAALASATELASLMIVPPVPAARDFLCAVLEEKPALSLGELVAQTSVPALTLVRPPDEIKTVVRDHPALLPLTWLADRLIESDRSPWEAEFEKKCHLSSALKQPTST
jgi:hypothetical protein